MELFPNMNLSVSTDSDALDPQLWLSGLTPLIQPPIPMLEADGFSLVGLAAAGVIVGVGVVLIAWQWRRIHLAWCLWQLGRHQDQCACCRLYRCLIRTWPRAVLLRRQAEKGCFLPPDRLPPGWRIRRMVHVGYRLVCPWWFR